MRCPPGLRPGHPARRAANAAIPAEPQCHDGSAGRAGSPPVRFSYHIAPRLSCTAPDCSQVRANHAADRFAAVSIPASARSSRTQPIPAAPLSSPT